MNKNKAVLLVNLGTPAQPTATAVRQFLRDFLSDKRVVDLSRWLWLPILYLIILPIRSRRVAKLYKKIWMEQGSPLQVYTQSIQHKLQTRLPLQRVDYAMTYGTPSIAERLKQFKEQGIEQLTILPLYPQYSVTTTAPIFDKLSLAISAQFSFPEIHFIRDYHEHPLYISLLVDTIKASWQAHGQSDCLVFSFHGIPRRYVDLGDLYQQHCQNTVALVVAALKLAPKQYRLCYQSRVGREQWLTPYLDETLPMLVKNGVKSVDVISPAFACDCLETLEELAIENRALFLESGGTAYHYIPCGNDSDAQLELLAALVAKAPLS